MRIYGKVIEYDGYVGTIIDSKGIKYLLICENIDGELDNGDFVSFIPELYTTIEIQQWIARFVIKENDN